MRSLFGAKNDLRRSKKGILPLKKIGANSPFIFQREHEQGAPTVTLSVPMHQNDSKPLTVTVATARKISGLGNTTIWGLIKQRKLEVVRVRRRTLITFRSLEALLAPTSVDPAETSAGDRQ
jgi:hypothetical protein